MVVLLLLVFAALVRAVSLPFAKGRAIFNVCAWGGLWLVIGFRDFRFGFDTSWYVQTYDTLSRLSNPEFLIWITSPDVKDPTFYAFARLLAMSGLGPRGWLLVLAGIFCLSIGFLVHKYSPEPFLSFVVVLSLGLAFFATTALRQALAMSILFWAFHALYKRQLVPFLLIVGFASLFHSTAIVFLVAYPLARLSAGWKQWGIVGGSLLAAFTAQGMLRSWIEAVAWSDQLRGYAESTTTLTLSGFIILTTVLAFAGLFMDRVEMRDPRNILFYNLAAIATALLALVIVVAEFFRIAYLFSFSVAVLLPMCIVWGPRVEHRGIIYLGVLSVLVAYLFWGEQFAGMSLSI